MLNKIISIKGLNAIVCGSTSGIGKEIAIELSKKNVNVTLFSRDENKLKNTILLLNKFQKSKHQYIIGDFDNPNIIEKKIKKHINNNNSYEILINNSGGPKSGDIINAKKEEYLQAFNRHVICNQILVQNLYKGMKNSKYGRIINIISTSVKEPIKGLGVSNTIRGAVASWSKTLSQEISKDNITVNNVLPGYTKTDRLKYIIKTKAIKNNSDVKSIEDKMKNNIPIGRFAKPKEIAKAVVFLCSPNASYINGINLPVDGGRLNTI